VANNQLLASDNFASGSLAAGWTAIPTQVKSQVAGTPFVAEPPSTSAAGRQYWSGLTWPNDQASEATFAHLVIDSASSIDLWVRVQSGSYSGYVVSIGSSATQVTARLYRCDSGTFTDLTDVLSGLTDTVGDVWTIQAAGSFIVVYQNGNMVMRYADATYTSGSPGFSQSSTASVSASQVGSWRGYSAVQQDGIWQKQGTVAGLAPLAGDIATGAGGLANATMLYEGNAQILSGTVYKMWFSAGHPTVETNTYYAESTDGFNWTRYGSAVLSSFGSPFIIKNGTTYYMYVQPSTSTGAGNFSVYTSTTGLTWTLQASNILGALGGSGVWDGVTQWYFQPVAITGGTWYALYNGTNNDAVYQLKLGLATSTDGITWTKYSGNPVLTAPLGGSVVNSGAVVNVGGTYYMWMYGNQPGTGSSTPSLDPGEGVRYQTTDFIHWTGLVHSVHRSQIYEGVNFIYGQSYPNGIFDINGKATMFIQSATSDSQTPSQYQFSLAIGPTPIASVVTKNEDAMSQVASDGFTGGTGPLSANWTTVTGDNALQVVSGNNVEGTSTSADSAAYYSGAAFNADQYSEFTISTLSVNNLHSISPLVRVQSGSQSYYQVYITGPTGTSESDVVFYKDVAGTFTKFGPTITITTQVGDVIRVAVTTASDGNPILSFYQNGFLMLQSEDYGNSLTSGSPGIKINTSVLADAQITSWAGGNANVLPSYSYSVSGSLGVTAAGATVSYTGTSSGSTTADVFGNYVISVPNGTYTITPTLSGRTFSPASFVVMVNGANVTGVNFSSAGAYSVPDCRKYATFPNLAINVNGTLTYIVQTSSNPAVPGTDSRASKPVDSSTQPQNSRTPGIFGPGE